MARSRPKRGRIDAPNGACSVGKYSNGLHLHFFQKSIDFFAAMGYYPVMDNRLTGYESREELADRMDEALETALLVSQQHGYQAAKRLWDDYRTLRTHYEIACQEGLTG